MGKSWFGKKKSIKDESPPNIIEPSFTVKNIEQPVKSNIVIRSIVQPSKPSITVKSIGQPSTPSLDNYFKRTFVGTDDENIRLEEYYKNVLKNVKPTQSDASNSSQTVNIPDVQFDDLPPPYEFHVNNE